MRSALISVNQAINSKRQPFKQMIAQCGATLVVYSKRIEVKLFAAF